ncbi:hypothetical protein [Lacticaseibacillus saniviri]|nr:hypothetical protein [Lacticaseibacillus saniviri]MCG4282882.1 hypothetical protein [Lacticaseibacillus saniviri]
MGYYWKPLLFGMVVLIAVLGLVFRVFDQRDNVVAVGVYSSAYKRDESKVLQKQVAAWTKPQTQPDRIGVLWQNTANSRASEQMSAVLTANKLDLLITDPIQFKVMQKQNGVAGLPLTAAQTKQYQSKLLLNQDGQAIGIKVNQVPALQKLGLKQQIVFTVKQVPHERQMRQVVLQLLAKD